MRAPQGQGTGPMGQPAYLDEKHLPVLVHVAVDVVGLQLLFCSERHEASGDEQAVGAAPPGGGQGPVSQEVRYTRPEAWVTTGTTTERALPPGCADTEQSAWLESGQVGSPSSGLTGVALACSTLLPRMRLWTPHPGSFTWLDVMRKGLLARTVTGWGGERENKAARSLVGAPYASSKASQAALVVKNPPAKAGDARDTGLIPGLGRSPGEEMATHSSVLAGKSHGQRSLGGHSLQGHKESDMTEHLSTRTSPQRLSPPWQGSAGWEEAGMAIRAAFWSTSSEASQLGPRPTGPLCWPFREHGLGCPRCGRNGGLSALSSNPLLSRRTCRIQEACFKSRRLAWPS